MPARDACLEHNRRYAARFRSGALRAPPAKKLAVVACMDARLMPDQLLGLEIGDAHVIRNAGGIVSDDAIRSLIISQRLLGTNEVFVINHTDCGMLTFTDEHLQQELRSETGLDASDIQFHTFKDLEDNVRTGVAKIKANAFISNDIAVHGFVYQVEDGVLREVA
jgi:carbonic anhydrase